MIGKSMRHTWEINSIETDFFLRTPRNSWEKKQLDALFHVFILFHVSTYFVCHSAHHQEIELY